MKVIDLTHVISEDMQVYPGSEAPRLYQIHTCEKDGYQETILKMGSHTGTHMDAPGHLFKGRTTLDQFPMDQFVGTALVIDCRDLKEGERIPLRYIEKYGEKADKAEFLLFNLGWDKRWGTPEYFGAYPYLSDEVVSYFVGRNKKGVGFDVIGIDPISDNNLTIHKKILKHNEIVVIENLRNLDLVGDDLFTFIALPLFYKEADGAPARAIAFWS
jgi:kynurenine formamidase